jgi:Tol biopolymer transport system component/predicted Ser/Thr protein kinase
MPLTPGEKLGRYEILAPIGKGGMGEVYKAHDPSAGRDVALKVSHAQYSDRFEREARAVAALNHPNICALYDVGPDYLVMEYIEGPTLAERMQRGPIPLAEALEIARQMAAALEEAHQNLVVHRDFKPANVKIKPNGAVKVLDFGLAKVTEARATEDSPTLTMSGAIMGTAAYMSPEQARGEPVDKRADVWAFGVVLWEMLAGRRLFEGKTISDVLAAVIRDQPDLGRVPANVRPLLKRCLEKDPQRRLRDIGDAMGIVENVVATAPSQSRLGWIAAAAAMLAFAVMAFVHFRQALPEARVMTTTILPPENTSLDLNPPALSPDGRRIVFRARGADGKTQLWVRPLDSPTAQSLAGTENALYPFWSPDSRSVAFFADGKLKRIEAAGGPAQALADASLGSGGSWSPEGPIVFAPNNSGPLQQVAAAGGASSPATVLTGSSSHRFPWVLPDGRHFLFEDQSQLGASEVTVRIGALDSQEVKTVGPANSNAVYAGGYLLYQRQNTLIAQPFDAQRLATTGEATSVAEQVRSAMINGAQLGVWSVSRDELLAFQAGAVAATQQLTWFDRAGKRVGTLGDPGNFYSLEFSPDRRRVAASRIGQSTDLWIYDVARGIPQRFTFGPAAHTSAVWSPDGRSVVYRSNPTGSFELYRKAADGTGSEDLLYADSALKVPTSWSPDGRFLLFQRSDPKTGFDIWVLPLEPAGGPKGAPAKPFLWLATQFNENFAQFSPDGRWVVYNSDESGQFETYVAPFPGPGGKRQISAGGGFESRWRADGTEIFYAAPNGTLMAAEVSTKGPSIKVGAIRSLNIPVITTLLYLYDVSSDGQRFLVAAPREQTSSAPLTLVQNWSALLKKK